MARIDFFVQAIPRGQARVRHARVGNFSKAYKTEDQKRDEQTLQALMMPHRPEKPLSGPLYLGLVVFCPIPSSKSVKWKMQATAGKVRPITKPDASNVLKHVEDVMQSMMFFEDDKQIVSLIIRKVYSDKPGYHITLEEIK